MVVQPKLTGFDCWFGGYDWRKDLDRHSLEFESAPGVWVDLSEWMVNWKITPPPPPDLNTDWKPRYTTDE